MFGVDEDRNFRRMNIGCEITYKKNDSTISKTALARNISSTGILFVANEKFEPDEVAKIAIAPGTSAIPEFKATIRTIRCTPTKNIRQYEIAAELETKE